MKGSSRCIELGVLPSNSTEDNVDDFINGEEYEHGDN